MSKLIISVVIPALNEESCIAQCLTSVFAQDYPRDQIEVIVVDNGSTDSTSSIARQFSVQVIEELGVGPARARNAGIRIARGEIIVFLDADCVAKSSWLRELLCGNEDNSIGCFIGKILPMTGGGIVSDFIHDRGIISQEALLASNPPVAAGANIAYRKIIFEEIGYFDENLSEAEDGDLFWRFVKHKRFNYIFQERAIVFHPHPSSLSVFLLRTRIEGRGLARFRLKHRDDFPKQKTSLARYIFTLINTFGGFVKYPIQVWREKKKVVMQCKFSSIHFLRKHTL